MRGAQVQVKVDGRWRVAFLTGREQLLSRARSRRLPVRLKPGRYLEVVVDGIQRGKPCHCHGTRLVHEDGVR